MESLNLDLAKKELVVKALNKCKTIELAAEALGVNVRSVYIYKTQYEIVKDNNGTYHSKQQQHQYEKS